MQEYELEGRLERKSKQIEEDLRNEFESKFLEVQRKSDQIIMFYRNELMKLPSI